jgi:Carboxypeptidase regulatory-like domain
MYPCCRPKRLPRTHDHLSQRAVTLTLLLALASARPASAQTVQGTVLDALSDLPIHTAEVALLARDDSIVELYVTDRDGRFVAQVPDADSYRLRAARIGYASFTTDTFALDAGQDIEAELRLQPVPFPLDSLAAVVDVPRPQRLVRVGFYRRQAKGFGHFLTPQDLEARRPIFPEDLFYGMSGVRVRSRGRVLGSFYRPCALSVTIDGLVVERGGNVRSEAAPSWTDLVHVNDIEAIEVYPHAGGVPVWVGGSISPCGAILIWTKGS